LSDESWHLDAEGKTRGYDLIIVGEDSEEY